MDLPGEHRPSQGKPGTHSLSGAAAAPTAQPPSGPVAAGYTCPMHPEIRQDKPGNCPECGMALEPVMPRLDDDDEQAPELIAFTRRFWWTLPLTLTVSTLAMFGHRVSGFDRAMQS